MSDEFRKALSKEVEEALNDLGPENSSPAASKVAVRVAKYFMDSGLAVPVYGYISYVENDEYEGSLPVRFDEIWIYTRDFLRAVSIEHLLESAQRLADAGF